MIGKLLAATSVAAVLTVGVVVIVATVADAGPVTPLYIARVIIGISLISAALVGATTGRLASVLMVGVALVGIALLFILQTVATGS